MTLNKKLSLSLALIITFLFGDFAFSIACSCVRPPLLKSFSEANYVFLGKVKDFTIKSEEVTIDGKEYDSQYGVASFQLEKLWKGEKIESLDVTTGMGGGDCGFNFEHGKSYLVFAYNSQGHYPKYNQTNDEFELQTDICTLTAKANIRDTQMDITELDKLLAILEENQSDNFRLSILLIMISALMLVLSGFRFWAKSRK